MKTKKSHRKLALNKDTIVNLDSAQLGKVGGNNTVYTTISKLPCAWPWETEERTDCPSCDTCVCSEPIC